MAFRAAKPFPFDEAVQLTVQDRYNIASTVAAQARGNFLTASLDLENSARDLEGVLIDIEQAIDELIELRAEVEHDRDSYVASAKALKAIAEPQLALF